MIDRPQRRLAAIVSTDVVGYSRLIGVDEVGTLARMKAHRAELWNPEIEANDGRVVGTAGDSLLVEFASAVAAVEFALAVQQGMAEREASQPDDTRMLLRVGVNIGEVVVDGDDILGDGVNVAARLQALAAPGGICLSGKVHDEITGKVAATFEDAGAQEVKNIARPVQVWCWSASQARPATETPVPKTVTDKPSIAVLAFTNMSGDPEQEYFSDGISEDIITALSRFRSFHVTARNSTFTYKGQSVDIKKVGQELGVRYVLEGSVRKAGSRVRITAQLIEATTGNHLWAERYDRELSDIFELQDEITMTIAAAVEPELTRYERDRALRKRTNDLDAWDFFQRGSSKIWTMTREGMTEGAGLMRKAIEIDPDFGQPYGFLAFVSYFDVILGRTDDRDHTWRTGVEYARRAIAIDQRDYIAHWSLGRLYSAAGNHKAAISELETAIGANPNFVHGYHGLSNAHLMAGHPNEAITYAETAIRLSPNDPYMWSFVAHKGSASAVKGDLDSAIHFMEQACRYPSATVIPHVHLAGFYALAGRMEDAADKLRDARQIEPNVSIRLMDEFLGTADRASFEKFYEGYRKAGLPE